jgi:hypothetical protein
MSSAWVSEELKTVRLDDRRLEQRLRLVLSQLAERPTASIAAACGGHAEMTAAYRLFGNEKASFGAILQAHVDATRERINAQRTVVLVQDTTELDLTRPERQVTGAGPLDGASRFGALLHVLYGFTPDGTPMGVVAAEAWTRSAGEARASSQSRAQRAAMPIEEKESYRWVRTLGAAEQLARGCPATQCISVADSEADVYELLAAAAESQVRWIVRACQNRALRPENGVPGERLWERALAAPPLFAASALVEDGWDTLPAVPWSAVGAVLYVGLLATVAGFGAWGFLIRTYSASAIAPFSLLVPVFGMAAAAVLTGETITPARVLAGVLVVAGVLTGLGYAAARPPAPIRSASTSG